jgi:hypothetical protein
MLKLTVAADSLEEKTWTGTETSPKEMVAEPIERAAMATRFALRGKLL